MEPSDGRKGEHQSRQLVLGCQERGRLGTASIGKRSCCCQLYRVGEGPAKEVLRQLEHPAKTRSTRILTSPRLHQDETLRIVQVRRSTLPPLSKAQANHQPSVQDREAISHRTTAQNPTRLECDQ